MAELRRGGRLAAWLIALVALAVPSSALGAPGTDDYDGLGAWVDIFDDGLMSHPVDTVAAADAHGADTIYVETSNFTQRRAVVRRAAIGRMIDAAHDRGMSLVTWYLPGLRSVRRDLRRSKAAIELKSPAGEQPDSFALDIESTAVADPRRRSARVRRLGRRLRRFAGAAYPLGAIIPSPLAMKRFAPSYWPGFPYDPLDRRFDVFLPMAYSTYHEDRGYEGFDGVRRYTARNVTVLRREVGENVPIQMVGGIADRLSKQEAAGFADAVTDRDLLGGGLYDMGTMSPGDWEALGPIVP